MQASRPKIGGIFKVNNLRNIVDYWITIGKKHKRMAIINKQRNLKPK